MTDIAWIEAGEALPCPRSFFQDNPELPDSLIAMSAEMSPERLIEAYSQGMFPWYSAGDPVMWWCTAPRMVLNTNHVIVRESLAKSIRQIFQSPSWEIRVDHAFTEVMQACANSPRSGQSGGTWITDEVLTHYASLFDLGIAHSVETWFENRLVGGLYCINLGKMVYGESMFSRVSNASKIALVALCTWLKSQDIDWIDCQQETEHLASMGATPLDKTLFLDGIASRIKFPAPDWKWDKNVLQMIKK